MSKFMAVFFSVSLGVIPVFNMITYSTFYSRTMNYSSTEAMSIELEVRESRKSIECDITYEYLVDGISIQSSGMTPWQASNGSGVRDAICNFAGKDSGIVRYDPANPTDSFLQDEMPVSPFVYGFLCLILLIFAFRVKN
ncbi:hypothetical protein IHN32_15605 [Deinococcus sp. 14RED07]|uniref:DUF3592 domain-containing protein n=1 Tax=Deinococcus sp. 14RED07 TaxID=2745874 RepID=UPI001E47ADED|nr:DUF3592 domain-containing protein [Deinococcus sp. 14RED07]MCD0177368.1 hypothetical protein [Deinococcus sp. 14RED07]